MTEDRIPIEVESVRLTENGVYIQGTLPKGLVIPSADPLYFSLYEAPKLRTIPLWTRIKSWFGIHPPYKSPSQQMRDAATAFSRGGTKGIKMPVLSVKEVEPYTTRWYEKGFGDPQHYAWRIDVIYGHVIDQLYTNWDSERDRIVRDSLEEGYDVRIVSNNPEVQNQMFYAKEEH